MSDSTLGIAHIALVVNDIKESVKFYCGALGFEQSEGFETESLDIAYLKKGSLVLELLCHKDDPIPSRGTGLFDHLAFSVSDIEQEIARLKALGIAFEFEVPKKVFGNQTIIFFLGPDGERIELVQQG
ncbi:MAG: VOC family protein [Bacillota bacterium]|nr:VOC family protein [Bacillota bacterium]